MEGQDEGLAESAAARPRGASARGRARSRRGGGRAPSAREGEPARAAAAASRRRRPGRPGRGGRPRRRRRAPGAGRPRPRRSDRRGRGRPRERGREDGHAERLRPAARGVPAAGARGGEANTPTEEVSAGASKLLNVRPPAIVVDVGFVNGLSAIRSLRRAGVRVFAVDHKPSALGFRSRSCDEDRGPEPARRRGGFVQTLRGLGPGVVFATHDEGLRRSPATATRSSSSARSRVTSSACRRSACSSMRPSTRRTRATPRARPRAVAAAEEIGYPVAAEALGAGRLSPAVRQAGRDLQHGGGGGGGLRADRAVGADGAGPDPRR